MADSEKKKDKKSKKAQEEVAADEPPKESKKKDKKEKKSSEAEANDEAPAEPAPEEKKKKKSKAEPTEQPAKEAEASDTKTEKKSTESSPKEEPAPEVADKKKSKSKAAPAEEPAEVQSSKKKEESKSDKKSKKSEPAEEPTVAASTPTKSDVKESAAKQAAKAADKEPEVKDKKKDKKPPKKEESDEEDEDDGEEDDRTKLLFVGATGEVGNVVMNLALREQTKYAVYALVRDPTKMSVQQRTLAAGIIKGECTKAEDVDNAVEDMDAVLVTLGHRKGESVTVINDSIKHIITSMKKHKVKRLIILASACINDFGDKDTIGRKLMKASFDKKMLADQEGMSTTVETMADTLDWIIVRAPKITKDQEGKGKYKTGHIELGATASVTRGDVAHFMLAQLTDDQFIHKRPMISN